MSTVGRVLCDVRCSLLVGRGLLSVVDYVMFVVGCWSFVGCLLLFVVFLTSVVVCCLSV